MSRSNAAETDLLNYVFKNVEFPWDAATNLYVSLHSSDPGEVAASGQATNEVSYTGYARVAVVRTGSGWTVAGDTASNAAIVQFPTCTGGSVTATHVGVGSAVSGAGNLIYSGALTSTLAISNNITPQFAIGQLSVTED